MRFLNNYSPFAATILRVTVGLILLAHGLPKLLIVGAFVDGTGAIVGQALKWPVGLGTIAVEVGAALFLVIGVKVRLAAFVSAVWFFGIAIVVHTLAHNDFWMIFNRDGSDSQSHFEFPFLIAVVCLAVSFLGAGRYGQDE
ncbi:MAG: DoxX family protein [Spirochaetales bacterium]|nr:DoxX family protein [Leptospiraceae bacterium]MCP5479857.1 DoxX family protein [Spirochaetales bacterium]MCP5486247.1 DoxX family protein [Spirochaetales bacterium]